MKKKIILAGALLAAFLMLMMPYMSASNAQIKETTSESNDSHITAKSGDMVTINFYVKSKADGTSLKNALIRISGGFAGIPLVRGKTNGNGYCQFVGGYSSRIGVKIWGLYICVSKPGYFAKMKRLLM